MAKAAIKRTLDRNVSSAAYTLVDLSGLHKETRDDIVRDALEGGGLYGIRIVEESVNGAARAPIFGFYRNGADEERWLNAKKELGLDSTEIDDGAVAPTDIEITDARQEAALREAAAQRANAEADKIRAGEAEAIAAITGDDGDEGREPSTPNLSANRTGAVDGHATNVVDTTLAKDATNKASEAGSSAKAEPNRGRNNKAPK